jgi:hypothetical protein
MASVQIENIGSRHHSLKLIANAKTKSTFQVNITESAQQNNDKVIKFTMQISPKKSIKVTKLSTVKHLGYKSRTGNISIKSKLFSRNYKISEGFSKNKNTSSKGYKNIRNIQYKKNRKIKGFRRNNRIVSD